MDEPPLPQRTFPRNSPSVLRPRAEEYSDRRQHNFFFHGFNAVLEGLKRSYEEFLRLNSYLTPFLFFCEKPYSVVVGQSVFLENIYLSFLLTKLSLFPLSC
jgi:hypothetical protein